MSRLGKAKENWARRALRRARAMASIMLPTVDRTSPPTQTTWCYCPHCKEDLISSPGTTYRHNEHGFLVYVCGPCGKGSTWHFDAPVPILLARVGE